jgi:hypothetical protein
MRPRERRGRYLTDRARESLRDWALTLFAVALMVAGLKGLG